MTRLMRIGTGIWMLALASCASGLSVEDQAATIVASTLAPPTLPAATPAPTATATATPVPSETASPTPTPTPLGGGGLIAFASNRFGHDDIFTIRPDGSDLRRLTDSLLEDRSPAWSPDGAWIAYASGGTTTTHDLWLMRGDGSGKHRLVKGNIWTPPSWSPDSREVVMEYYMFLPAEGGSTSLYGLYLAGVDGSGQRFLHSSRHWRVWSGPAWSPDGAVIAAHPHEVPGVANGEIYLIEVGSGELRRVTHSIGNDYLPAWSPDGSWLAFTSDRHGQAELFRIRPDGTEEQRLTDHWAWDWQASWSPDGRWIVFSSNRSGNYSLYLLEIETGEVLRLTHDVGDHSSPNWSRVTASGP